MHLTQIKFHRLRAGWRQIQLSLATGISRCRLSELECGYHQPRPDELQKLAAALHVDVDALVTPPAEVTTAGEVAA